MRLRTALPLILVCLETALAGTVGVEYIKTLGQSSPYSAPVVTTGGHVAVDADGFIYCGTPGLTTSLAKLTPEGRTLWKHFHNIPGFQGVAIDETYVYTCGAGHYGWRQVFRFRRSDGGKAQGWQLEWKGADPVDGVRAIALPAAIAVDAKHLYVVDRTGDELRRLDKATGKDAPFPHPVKIVQPRDVALTPDGRLLVCGPEAIIELDLEGEPLRLPLVAELDNAVAVAFDPETDGFFVAEGGSGAALVNRVRQFDRDGKPTGWTLGRGGNAQGIWSPDAFAFSEGSGDIVVAQDGSLWVNPGWRHKLYRAFRSLSHFTRDGEYTHTIMGVASFSGIAADRDLSVYIGGQVKVDIENRPVWTSGLVRSGSGDGFPSTHVDFWPTAPVMVGRRLFIYGEADGSLFELDPATGRCDREPGAFYKVPAKSALAGSDDALYCLKKDDSRIYRVPLELRGELEPIADLAEPPVNDARLAVSADGSLACVRRGETLTAYQLPDGKTLWTRPARGGVVVLGDMVVTGAPGTGHAGLQVLDAGGGTKLCMIGDRKIRGVAPFPVGAPIAGVSTDDGHYLFVEAGGGIRVLKLAHHTAENVTPPNVPVEPRPEEDGNAK